MSVVAEDFIRQVKSFLENYEPQLENKNWLKRRMRFLLETFTQEHSDAAALDTIWIWRLICTEVLLRACRDIVAFRSQALNPGVPLDPATVENNVKILANLQITWCDVFKPLGVEAWEQLEMTAPNSSLERYLKRQLLRREVELVRFAERGGLQTSSVRAAEWFAGMPQLVQHFVNFDEDVWLCSVEFVNIDQVV